MIYYESILRFTLRFRWAFLLVVSILVFFGIRIMQNTSKEFMPSLDEGAFLLMPTSMPHSGGEENIKNLQLLDILATAIPKVETVVTKEEWGNSPLYTATRCLSS